MKQTSSTCVQYGCGIEAPSTWINFDASPNLWLERLPLLGRFYVGSKRIAGKNVRQRFPEHIKYGDIVAGLPLQPASCDAVFASHILEHLSLADFRTALVNTHQLLKSDGVFRLIVPDLKAEINKYLASSSQTASIDFIRSMGVGTEQRATGVKGLLKNTLGNSGHLWMWDYNALEIELEQAGFTNIRRAQFNDSAEKAFAAVEALSRFKDAVAIECCRPGTATAQNETESRVLQKI